LLSLQEGFGNVNTALGPIRLGKKFRGKCTADQKLLVRRHFVIEGCVVLLRVNKKIQLRREIQGVLFWA